MKDIEVIGSSYVLESFQLLTETYDRVRATIYFADLCAKYADEANLKLARWHYRASLSEFKSIFDTLPADLRRKNLDKAWSKSLYSKQITYNPLVKVLKKVRNLAIHTVNLPGSHKAMDIIYIDEDGQRPLTKNCIFIDELQRSVVNKEITDDELLWFNRQAKTWPADLLIREAIFQTSIELANFLSMHKSDTDV